MLTFLCAILATQVGESYGSANEGSRIPDASPSQSVNLVVQWNKNLLVIVRTPRAQPATIHPHPRYRRITACLTRCGGRSSSTQKSW
jgi:hypothetical protein